ncbi:hypothetical protein MASR1M66_10690 [Aminivibrio sp.]
MDIRTTEKEMEDLIRTLRQGVEGQDVPEKLKEARAAENAQKPVIVIGSSLASYPSIVTEAVNLAVASGAFFRGRPRVVPMLRASNSLGALNTVTGTKDWLTDSDLDFLYVLSTGMRMGQAALEAMSRHGSSLYNAFMSHPLVNMADVLLPLPRGMNEAVTTAPWKGNGGE